MRLEIPQTPVPDLEKGQKTKPFSKRLKKVLEHFNGKRWKLSDEMEFHKLSNTSHAKYLVTGKQEII